MLHRIQQHEKNDHHHGSILRFWIARCQKSANAATKSYVLTLSQSLATELNAKDIYIQAVLPAATRTEIYERIGADISNVPDVMEVEELVNAALIGFDRQELVTIPPVPDIEEWNSFEHARMLLAQGFSNSRAAARYSN